MAILAFLAIGALVAACGGSSASGDSGGVLVTPIEPTIPVTVINSPSANGGASSTPSAPSNGPSNDGRFALQGFVFPLSGGCLPRGDQLMPNAPRTYRNGVHEGIDFYDSDNCTGISKGTSVLATKAGRVVRADLDYTDPTQSEINAYLNNPNTEDSLDKFRGRQVWIEHGTDSSGARVITRYAHLSGIAPGITRGTQVSKGQLVAYVGESGTPESLTKPGSEYHLHFELRVGDSYLGKGQSPSQVRALYQTAFAPLP